MHREVWLEDRYIAPAISAFPPSLAVKPNAKLRGDVQELHLRCGTSGTSWHVTTKSSICDWGVLYKWSVYAVTVQCLTLGGLSIVQGRTDRGVIHGDR